MREMGGNFYRERVWQNGHPYDPEIWRKYYKDPAKLKAAELALETKKGGPHSWKTLTLCHRAAVFESYVIDHDDDRVWGGVEGMMNTPWDVRHGGGFLNLGCVKEMAMRWDDKL